MLRKTDVKQLFIYWHGLISAYRSMSKRVEMMLDFNTIFGIAYAVNGNRLILTDSGNHVFMFF